MATPAASDAAFAKAAHVVTLDLVNQRLVPASMEPRSAMASYDAATDRVTLRLSSQMPSGARDLLCEPAGSAGREDPRGGRRCRRRVRHEGRAVSGGDRRRLRHPPDQRPVKWTPSRLDEFLSATHGRDIESHAELALDANGKVLAYRIRTLANMGAYGSTVGIIIQLMIGPWVSTSIYDIRTIDFDLRAILTNTAPTAAYRGAGRPEAIYLIERLFDVAAQKLGLDPAEIRRRNLIAPEQMPYTNAMGQVYDSGNFGSILKQALALAKWDDFASREAELEVARHAARPWAGVVPGMDRRQRVRGAGDRLGVRRRRDRGVCLDDADGAGDRRPPTPSLSSTCSAWRSSASGSSWATPTVDRASAAPARGRCSPPDRRSTTRPNWRWRTARTWRRRRWRPRLPTSNTPRACSAIAGTDRGIGLFELAAQQPDRRIYVDATSTVGGPSWPNGAHIAEVEVDPDTGAVEIVSYVSVNDVGRVVNPMIVRGQLDGGAVQGIGQALGEHMRYEPGSGQVVTASMMDYFMPRADIIRDFVHELDQSTPCLTNPLGVKGVGELGTIGATPAVVNAVADALVRAGRVEQAARLQMPLTPPRSGRHCTRGEIRRRLVYGVPMPDGLYERDVLAWSQHQADLLRRLGRGERVNDVDWTNIAEEIEDVGLSELHSVESFLTLILVHLLKL